jgi:predicted membrane protein
VVLLDHMGLISSDRLWKFWPVLLLVLGVIKLVEPYNRVFGAVLTLVGALFLVNNLGYTHLSWWDMWPIALICAGLMLIWNRFEMPKLPKLPPMTSSAGPNDINEFALFGAVERRITVGNFTGGTASATFGGVELDFRSADIEGEQAVLYLEAIFGGIELTVPDRWAVVYEGQSIFGGFSDETRPPLPEVPGAPPKKRIILRGRAVFGGISVKN